VHKKVTKWHKNVIRWARISISSNVETGICHADGGIILRMKNAYSAPENIFLEKQHAFFSQHPISPRASYRIDDRVISYRSPAISYHSQRNIVSLLYMYDTNLTTDNRILRVDFMTFHSDTFDHLIIVTYWQAMIYITWWRMALFAVLKIRIGYFSYKISRHLHSIFHRFPSDIPSPLIRHRFNHQNCPISAHSHTIRLIFTHGRKSFTHTTTTYTRERNRSTHTTTTYTHERNRSTHTNASKWTLRKPKVSHFVLPDDLYEVHN
jgi:hypothetical protein